MADQRLAQPKGWLTLKKKKGAFLNAYATPWCQPAAPRACHAVVTASIGWCKLPQRHSTAHAHAAGGALEPPPGPPPTQGPPPPCPQNTMSALRNAQGESRSLPPGQPPSKPRDGEGLENAGPVNPPAPTPLITPSHHTAPPHPLILSHTLLNPPLCPTLRSIELGRERLRTNAPFRPTRLSYPSHALDGVTQGRHAPHTHRPTHQHSNTGRHA